MARCHPLKSIQIQNAQLTENKKTSQEKQTPFLFNEVWYVINKENIGMFLYQALKVQEKYLSATIW